MRRRQNLDQRETEREGKSEKTTEPGSEGDGERKR